MYLGRGRKSGFTLIELLVVIAIIAVLAAILFPIYSAARDRAREASCASNTCQIGKAMMLYVQDYSDRFPDCKGPYTAPCSTFNLQYKGVAGRLARYLGGSKSHSSRVYFCPACPYGIEYDPWNNNYGFLGSTPTKPLVAYAFRHCLTVYECYTASSLWRDLSPTPIALRTSDFCFPTKQVVFHEIAAWHHGYHCAWQPKSKVTGQPYLLAIYADGHAKQWKEPFLVYNGQIDDYPYDAGWFSKGPRGPLQGHGCDPRVNWDM